MKRSLGEYFIRFRTYLTDYPEVMPYTLAEPFVVTIVEPPNSSDYVFNTAPEWLEKLEDQFLVFGDSLIYSFGDRTNIFGD